MAQSSAAALKAPATLALRDLFLSVYLPSVLMSIGQMALVVILPLYLISRGESLSTAALVFAMRSVGSTLVNIPASQAIARFGIRAGMLGGIAMIATGALLIAVASNSWLIALATLVFGAGMGTWLLSRLSFITRNVARGERGRSMSTLAGIQRLGLLIGPFIGGLCATSLGFRWVFVFIMACAVANLLLVMFFSKAGKGERDQDIQSSRSNAFALVPGILYRHRQIFLGAGVFVYCLQLVREQRHLLITLWGAAIGLDTHMIGMTVSAAAILDLAMFPVAGYVMDYHGRRITGITCIVSLGTALGLLSFASTMPFYLALVMIAAAGNGLGSGIMLTLGSDLAPEQNGSEFLGVWRIFSDLGSFSGPVLTSLCASLTMALGLTCGIGLLGGAVLYFRAAETLPSKTTPV